MPDAGISGFTSDKTRARFMRAYDNVRRRRWPADALPVDAPTSFGATRVYRTGGDSRPFVLLPGAGGNALSWYRYLPRLAARPVVAPDPVGEPGCSVQNKPLGDGRDWAGWLHETIDHLGVDRPHLVGISFGGWVALQYDRHLPGRAASITLLDPAGFGRVSGRFLAWILLGGAATFSPTPVRRLAARALHNATLLDDDLTELIRASTGFRRHHPAPSPFTDGQLREVSAPTLTLLGRRSQMYQAQEVAARVRAQMPGALAEVVPDAGHDLPVRCPDLISERILRFAAANEPRA